MTFRHLRNVRGFFSDYYLGSVFGRGRKKGISDRETDAAYRRFLRIYLRAEGSGGDAAACRERLVRPLLRDVLGFHLGAGEERIHPLYPSAEAESSGQKPLLLVYSGAWEEALDAGRGATPARRLETALAKAGLEHGFLVTGERLRLVREPGEGPRGSYLEADLGGLADEEDPESFAALCRLFSASQYLPDAEGQAPIVQVEEESREHAAKVSDDLKGAVFRAAESLVSGLLDDAVARGAASGPETFSETELFAYRDAALTALYRILFVLYAEARDPRLEEHRLYRDAYSMHGLVEELVREPGRLWAENRCGLWERLKALFRVFDRGLPRITPWFHIPPRGGDFFKEDTPEGRILDAVRLSDASVARVILDLTTTAPRCGVGRERVSFRELDIEQLGAVYEGLLEYEPRVAKSTTLEVRVQGRTFALPPGEIARLCKEKALALKGDLSLAAGTILEAEAAGSGAGGGEEGDFAEEPAGLAEDSVLEGPVEEDGGEGETDGEGVSRGGSVVLVRRLEPGAFSFVPGPARKGSGSFYTPLPLVRDLVSKALGPLVSGKRAAEIERLRLLDPACGSAHFLVEAMRFLGRELHRAYTEEYGAKGPPHFRGTTGQGWDTAWKASDETARTSNSEARAWCKRRIAERCLLGVDLNPTAVSLARVALWIESLAGDRPLTYFEHHVRCGNSLMGTWLSRLDYPPLPSLEKQGAAGQGDIFAGGVRDAVEEAARTRRLIDTAADEGAVEAESVKEQEFKEHQRMEAERILAAARLLFDLRSASAFVPGIWGEWAILCAHVSDAEELDAYAHSRPWWGAFEETRRRERFFHWELEFPEIFLDPGKPGFDVVLGNPPWDKIKPDKKEFYGRHDVLIRAFVGGELDRRIEELERAIPGLDADFHSYEERVKNIASSLKKGGDYRFQGWDIEGKSTGGDPDMFKFFVERAHQVVREGGRAGMVVPSAVYNNEGCTGLRHLLLDESRIERFYAFENRRKIFPIDSRYKFVNLVFQKGKPEADGFEAAFMRHDMRELEDPSKKSWMVRVSRGELERLSPGTLAFLEYRSPRDREILTRMYEGRPLLGDRGPDTWNARFYTEFHMTNDRDLWTDPKTGKLWNPRQILGDEPEDFLKVRESMEEKGFWPLYQDAHIHQYVLEFKPLMRWVNLEAHEAKYYHLPDPTSKLVLRDPARNNDERTCIAAILPPKSCFGHTLNGIKITENLKNPLLCLLNSICFDYLARKRIGGQHVSPYLLVRNSVPDPISLVKYLPFPPKVRANQRKKWIYDFRSEWNTLWCIEKAVADAYALKNEDVLFFLEDFPVFARKRPAFFAYLRDRLAQWKAEAGGPVSEKKLYPLSADAIDGLKVAEPPIMPPKKKMNDA